MAMGRGRLFPWETTEDALLACLTQIKGVPMDMIEALSSGAKQR